MGRRTLTLLGPDVLLVAMGAGRANNAAFVVECEGELDGARLANAVERLLRIAPFMASRLERPWPWGRLRWRPIDAPPPVARRPLAADEAIEDAVERLLNDVVDPRRDPPLRWYAFQRTTRATSWLVLRWVHPLMDPRGAELLVAMLDAVDRGTDGARWAADRPIAAPDDSRPARARAALARRAIPMLQALGRERPSSLADAAGAPGEHVRLRRRTVRSASRQLPDTLVATGRAVAPLWRTRALPLDRPFVVPLSVDRRQKGEPGPVFGNFVSFHFARLGAAGTGDIAATAAAIRSDMAQAVRAELVEALWVGMNFVRYYPPRHLLRPLGGREVVSFHCADTGEVRPPLETLFGMPVRGAFHVPCVHAHPGLGIFFSRAGGLESIVAVWVDGVVAPDEIERVLDDIQTGIGASAA